MLRRVRIVLAVVCFVAVTLLFLDFTGTAQEWWGWIAKMQFIPALLSLNLLAVVSLVLLTLVFGRIYCSVICPLGVMQDVINRISRFARKKNKRRSRFSYSRPKTWMRVTMLILFFALIVAGFMPIASLIEPYSEYGRIVSSLVAPAYDAVNNELAGVAEGMDSYAFYRVDIYSSWAVTVVALVTLTVVGTMAWLSGRGYCNMICPVGTVLGYLSRFSLLKPVIDRSKCIGCTKCARNCKASCIDVKTRGIDYSRCVACMGCIDSCREGAIKYTVRYRENQPEKISGKVDESRRKFLTTSAVIAAGVAVKAADKTTDGGLAPIIDKNAPQRATRIVPPGAVSIANLEKHCTSCQLCITACPNSVLRPSTELSTFMQPVVAYDRGYCRPECVKCSEACPAGAIRPITAAEKSAIQIGHAVVRLDACIMASEGKRCGNCSRHCPVGAISLVPVNPDDKTSRRMPVVNEERCIGCGACENLCPVRPLSAIYVEGVEVHRKV